MDNLLSFYTYAPAGALYCDARTPAFRFWVGPASSMCASATRSWAACGGARSSPSTSTLLSTSFSISVVGQSGSRPSPRSTCSSARLGQGSRLCRLIMTCRASAEHAASYPLSDRLAPFELDSQAGTCAALRTVTDNRQHATFARYAASIFLADRPTWHSRSCPEPRKSTRSSRRSSTARGHTPRHGSLHAMAPFTQYPPVVRRAPLLAPSWGCPRDNTVHSHPIVPMAVGPTAAIGGTSRYPAGLTPGRSFLRSHTGGSLQRGTLAVTTPGEGAVHLVVDDRHDPRQRHGEFPAD